MFAASDPSTVSRATGANTTTETKVNWSFQWDPSYIKTIPGYLKVGALVLNVLVFICLMSSGAIWRYSSPGEWAYFVAITGFWITASLLIMYFLHTIERCQAIPWMMIEMIYCSTWAFFYFTASTAMAVEAAKFADNYFCFRTGATAAPSSCTDNAAFIAGSFFGYIAMLIYGYDGFLKVKGWRAGLSAQGDGTPQNGSAIFCCVV